MTVTLQEAIARAEKAEAAAGQMRNLIDARLRLDWHADECKERSGCTCGKDVVDAALATDAGKGWVSPEQVAQACAAARDAGASLVESWATNIETPPADGWTDIHHRGEAAGQAMLLRSIAHAIRALKVTP